MKKIHFLSLLFLGVIVLVIDIYGYLLLRNRPTLPQTIDVKELVQIEDVQVDQKEDIEFILSKRNIGDRLSIQIKVGDRIEEKETELIPFYSQAPFPSIYLLIGLFCLAMGVTILIICKGEASAHIFYLAALAFSSALIIGGGFFCLKESWTSYFPGILVYLSYPLAPAFLLHFSLQFYRKITVFKKTLAYTPAIIFAGLLEYLFLYSSLSPSIGMYRIYQSTLYIFHFYVILLSLLSVIFFILAFRRELFYEQRAQIKWVLYGLSVGLGPFIVLYLLPRIFRVNPLVSEELASLFFIFIPLAFAIAIIRYKLLNIEIVINRSLVYFILTVFTVTFYLFSVRILYNFFSRFIVVQDVVISVIAAFLAALTFHPARRKIQDIVDKSFFRVSYDYKKSLMNFNERAHRIASLDLLSDFYLSKVGNTIPVEHLGLFVYSKKSGGLKPLITKNDKNDLDVITSVALKSDKVQAKKKAVKTTERLDFSQEDILEEYGLEIALPLSFKAADLAGCVTLGKKKSGERYSRDDLELIIAMSRELALNLERIRLQEEVIYERAEKVKLNEINRMKTEFISTVSHEVRTPMSSISGLSEVLQKDKIKDDKKKEQIINLMVSECRRLSRLLHNILDFGKIEQKNKTYDFKKMDIQPIIKEVTMLMQHQRKSGELDIKMRMTKKPVNLDIDHDAVKQVLTNLIDNAIKYSPKTREIDIHLIDGKNAVEIQVKDKGIGIPFEEQEKIFKDFYRGSEAIRHNPRGVGLGLKIIRHIMDAHKGKIEVKSQPNKGSTFSLIFPKP